MAIIVKDKKALNSLIISFLIISTLIKITNQQVEKKLLPHPNYSIIAETPYISAEEESSSVVTKKLTFCFTGLNPKTRVLLIQKLSYSTISMTKLSEIFDYFSFSIKELYSNDNTLVSLRGEYDSVNDLITLSSDYFSFTYPFKYYCLISNSKVSSLSGVNNIKISAVSDYNIAVINNTTNTNTNTNTNIDFYKGKRYIAYNTLEYIDYFPYYSLNTYINAAFLPISWSFSKQSITTSTLFDLTITFKTQLPPNKQLLTKYDKMNIIIEFNNINLLYNTKTNVLNTYELKTDVENIAYLENQDITSNTNTNNSSAYSQLLNKPPKTSPSVRFLSQSKISFSDFGENFVNNRIFSIKFSNIGILKFSNDNFNLQTLVMYKNTNSVVSLNKTNFGVGPSKYSLYNVTFTHVNYVPILYSGSSFPMELKFSSDHNNLITSNDNNAYYSDITLKDESNLFTILSVTCDFSSNRYLTSMSSLRKKEYLTHTPFCLYNKSKNSVTIKHLYIKENIPIIVKFWISISSSIFNSVSVSSLSSKLSVSIEDEQTTTAYVNNILIKQGFLSSTEQYSTKSNCIYYDFPNNCESKLMVKEHSGNFLLLESKNTGVAEFNSTNDSPISLRALNNSISNINSNNRYFRLRLRSVVKDNSNSAVDNIEYANDIADSFSLDLRSQLTEGSSLNDSSDFSLGTWEFYFPSNEIQVGIESNQCMMSWISTKQAYTSNLTYNDYSKLVNYNSNATNISNTSTSTDIFNNYIRLNSITNVNTSSNSLYFNNYSSINGTNTITTGLFHHLLKPSLCSTDINNTTTCSYFNNEDIYYDSDSTVDYEIATNCLSYKNSFTNTSIYSSFDFIIAFKLKTSSSNNSITRITRFVSLLAQPGIFSLTNIIEENSNRSIMIPNSNGHNEFNLFGYDPILYDSYLYNISDSQYSVCLLSLSFDYNTLHYNSNSKTNINSSVNKFSDRTDTTLVMFLYGLELLELETNIDNNTNSLSYLANSYLSNYYNYPIFSNNSNNKSFNKNRFFNTNTTNNNFYSYYSKLDDNSIKAKAFNNNTTKNSNDSGSNTNINTAYSFLLNDFFPINSKESYQLYSDNASNNIKYNYNNSKFTSYLNTRLEFLINTISNDYSNESTSTNSYNEVMRNNILHIPIICPYASTNNNGYSHTAVNDNKNFYELSFTDIQVTSSNQVNSEYFYFSNTKINKKYYNEENSSFNLNFITRLSTETSVFTQQELVTQWQHTNPFYYDRLLLSNNSSNLTDINSKNYIILLTNDYVNKSLLELRYYTEEVFSNTNYVSYLNNNSNIQDYYYNMDIGNKDFINSNSNSNSNNVSTTFSTDTKIVINDVKFKYIHLLYINKSLENTTPSFSFLFNTDSSTSSNTINSSLLGLSNISSIITNKDNNNNSIGLFIGGYDTTKPNSFYYLSNISTTINAQSNISESLFKVSTVSSQTILSSQTKYITNSSIATKNIKDNYNRNKTICVNIELLLLAFTTKIDIFSENFTSDTIIRINNNSNSQENIYGNTETDYNTFFSSMKNNDNSKNNISINSDYYFTITKIGVSQQQIISISFCNVNIDKTKANNNGSDGSNSSNTSVYYFFYINKLTYYYKNDYVVNYNWEFCNDSSLHCSDENTIIDVISVENSALPSNILRISSLNSNYESNQVSFYGFSEISGFGKMNIEVDLSTEVFWNEYLVINFDLANLAFGSSNTNTSTNSDSSNDNYQSFKSSSIIETECDVDFMSSLQKEFEFLKSYDYIDFISNSNTNDIDINTSEYNYTISQNKYYNNTQNTYYNFHNYSVNYNNSFITTNNNNNNFDNNDYDNRNSTTTNYSIPNSRTKIEETETTVRIKNYNSESDLNANLFIDYCKVDISNNKIIIHFSDQIKELYDNVSRKSLLVSLFPINSKANNYNSSFVISTYIGDNDGSSLIVPEKEHYAVERLPFNLISINELLTKPFYYNTNNTSNDNDYREFNTEDYYNNYLINNLDELNINFSTIDLSDYITLKKISPLIPGVKKGSLFIEFDLLNAKQPILEFFSSKLNNNHVSFFIDNEEISIIEIESRLSNDTTNTDTNTNVNSSYNNFNSFFTNIAFNEISIFFPSSYFYFPKNDNKDKKISDTYFYIDCFILKKELTSCYFDNDGVLKINLPSEIQNRLFYTVFEAVIKRTDGSYKEIDDEVLKKITAAEIIDVLEIEIEGVLIKESYSTIKASSSNADNTDNNANADTIINPSSFLLSLNYLSQLDYRVPIVYCESKIKDDYLTEINNTLNIASFYSNYPIISNLIFNSQLFNMNNDYIPYSKQNTLKLDLIIDRLEGINPSITQNIIIEDINDIEVIVVLPNELNFYKEKYDSFYDHSENKDNYNSNYNYTPVISLSIKTKKLGNTDSEASSIEDYFSNEVYNFVSDATSFEYSKHIISSKFKNSNSNDEGFVFNDSIISNIYISITNIEVSSSNKSRIGNIEVIIRKEKVVFMKTFSILSNEISFINSEYYYDSINNTNNTNSNTSNSSVNSELDYLTDSDIFSANTQQNNYESLSNENKSSFGFIEYNRGSLVYYNKSKFFIETNWGSESDYYIDYDDNTSSSASSSNDLLDSIANYDYNIIYPGRYSILNLKVKHILNNYKRNSHDKINNYSQVHTIITVYQNTSSNSNSNIDNTIQKTTNHSIPNFITDKKQYYLDAQIKLQETIFVGLQCNSISGTYLLKLLNSESSSGVSNFFEIKPIFVKLSYNQTKSIIRLFSKLSPLTEYLSYNAKYFYNFENRSDYYTNNKSNNGDSGDNTDSNYYNSENFYYNYNKNSEITRIGKKYLGNDVNLFQEDEIYLGVDGFAYFYFGLESFNINDIEVYFSPDSENNTVDENNLSVVTIKGFNRDNYYSSSNGSSSSSSSVDFISHYISINDAYNQVFSDNSISSRVTIAKFENNSNYNNKSNANSNSKTNSSGYSRLKNKQKYYVKLVDDKCFSLSTDSITFYPKYNITSLVTHDNYNSNSNDLVSNYFNINFENSLNNEDLDKTSIKVNFSNTGKASLSVTNNLYCGLYIAPNQNILLQESDYISSSTNTNTNTTTTTTYSNYSFEPEVLALTEIPQPMNTWKQSYFYKSFNSNSNKFEIKSLNSTSITTVNEVVYSELKTFSHTFTGLLRDYKYNMKCVLETTNALALMRNKVSEIFKYNTNYANDYDNSDSSIITENTTSPKCLEFELKEVDEEFETKSLTVLQRIFNKGFYDNGCVVVIGNNGYPVNDNYKMLLSYNQYYLRNRDFDERLLQENRINNNYNNNNISNYDDELSTKTNKKGFNIRRTNTYSNSINNSGNKKQKTNIPSNTNPFTNTFTNINTKAIANTNIRMTDTKYKFIQCFVQSSFCKSEFSSVYFYETIKNTLENKSSTSQYSLYLREFTQIQRDNFISFSVINPELDFDIDNIKIYSTNSSTTTVKLFNIANKTYLTQINVNVDVNYSNETKIVCFYSVAYKEYYDSIVNNSAYSDNDNKNRLADAIKNCSSSKNILCGSNIGFIPPYNINTTAQDLFKEGKRISMMITCKQNLPVNLELMNPVEAFSVLPIIEESSSSSNQRRTYYESNEALSKINSIREEDIDYKDNDNISSFIGLKMRFDVNFVCLVLILLL